MLFVSNPWNAPAEGGWKDVIGEENCWDICWAGIIRPDGKVPWGGTAIACDSKVWPLCETEEIGRPAGVNEPPM